MEIGVQGGPVPTCASGEAVVWENFRWACAKQPAPDGFAKAIGGMRWLALAVGAIFILLLLSNRR